jgi:hypothetical protein
MNSTCTSDPKESHGTGPTTCKYKLPLLYDKSGLKMSYYERRSRITEVNLDYKVG